MKRALVLASMLAALVGLVAAVHWTARPQPEGGFLIGLFGDEVQAPEVGVFGVGLSLGFLLLGGWLLGELFRLAKLPKLSGYLCFGLLAGPNLPLFVGDGISAWTALLPEGHLKALKLVDSLAIALIALMAGGELQISLLRRIARRVACTLAGNVLGVIAIVGAFLLAAGTSLPLLRDLPTEVRLFVSVALATLAISNSPAVVIAILKETRAKGPMQEVTLAVTIAKDLVLIVLVTALLAVGVAVLGTDPAASESRVGQLAWHLLGSIGVGGVIGVAMRLVTQRISVRLELFLVAAGFGIAVLSSTLGLATLLVALTAGFTQANLWPEGSARLFRSVEDLMLPVSIVFFANTGAGVDLSTLALVWPTAIAIVATRLAALWIGTTVGSRLGGDQPPVRTWVWTAFVPQAGVSLALALEFRTTFSSFAWAGEVYALIVGMIAVHELIGPPLFRLGLARAGEIRA